jgi:uncharacterized protein (UPF0303 family)
VNDDPQALIASLEAQERSLVFTRFDNADAWRLGSAMVAAATERELAVTIDIRRHGQQLFHAALPGTTPENDSWIERKVNVVNRFAAASYLVGRRLAARWTRHWASSRGCSRRTAARFRSASRTSALSERSPCPACLRPTTMPLSPR